MSEIPAVDVIDNARCAHADGRLTRAAAIGVIRSVVDVPDLGAADLLDHHESARVRYERALRPPDDS